MTRNTAAAASDPGAQSAAETVLSSGGGAADAIAAGYFAAAGARPDVLLAPAVALVAGHAAGARFFDGRSLQPGRGAARPRGFVSESEITPGARIAIPRAVAMTLLLHSYAGRGRLREVLRPGITAAQKASAPRRTAILRAIADRGLMGFRSRDVVRAFTELGGPLAGGMVCEQDFEDLRAGEAQALEIPVEGGATAILAPRNLNEPAPTRQDAPPPSHAPVEVIVACDAWNIAAALAYMPAGPGIAVDALELCIAPEAIPVMRGVQRVAAGTPLPVAAPIAVLQPPTGYIASVGFPGVRTVPESAWASILTSDMPFDAALERVCAQNDYARALAALSTGKAARAYHIRSD